MKLVAVTGSIGCGKTTLAGIIRGLGYAVFDVDGWVRRLYFNQKFLARLAKYFPEVVNNGAADKRKLRNIVFADADKRKLLESLIHPFLRQYLKHQIHKYARTNYCFFIDVALLFEMGWHVFCTHIIVADVPYELQKKRVMERDKVNAEDFEKINRVQIDNESKKAMADIVISTDKPKNLLKLELIAILQQLMEE